SSINKGKNFPINFFNFFADSLKFAQVNPSLYKDIASLLFIEVSITLPSTPQLSQADLSSFTCSARTSAAYEGPVPDRLTPFTPSSSARSICSVPKPRAPQ